MQHFEDYYQPEIPVQSDIDELSDPRLDFDQDREKTNRLVLNLVIKFIATYLEVDPRNLSELKSKVTDASKTTPDELIKIITGMTMRMDHKCLEASPVDALAIHSLLDLRTTAAIVKEIIFNQCFENDGKNFIGVDLGSGTGILTLATVIAGRRKRLRDILVLGIEIAPNLVRQSRRTLESILHGQNCHKIENLDATNPGMWSVLDGLPLHFWVSETIADSTPPLTLLPYGRIGLGRGIRTVVSLLANIGHDSFAQILDSTMRGRPNFVEDVIYDRTAMFPDLINGNYRPNFEQSDLCLRTGLEPSINLPLSSAGKEFEDYEDFNTDRRWIPDTDDEEQKTAALENLGTIVKAIREKTAGDPDNIL